MALPRFAVFNSNYNSKYLSYLKDEGEMHRFLQFSGEDVLSPYAKYALEPSKTSAKNGTSLVHIRCCYNNKYWVRSSQSTHWIVAASDNQEEDTSKWSCTLFEPVYLNDDDKTTARFRHAQLGNYACLSRSANEYASCLIAEWDSPNTDLCDVFTIINWESLLILPKRVAFKCSANGKYLSADSLALQFKSSDIGDPTVGYELFTTRDGSLRIKSDYVPATRWLSTGNVIVNFPDYDQEGKFDLFWPIKVDNNNVIALRNMGTNNFCRSGGGDENYLIDDVSTITKEARLEVEELVISRLIYDVNYRLDDARIYNEKILALDNGEATNTSENDDTYEVTLTYSKSESKTWSSSASLSVTVSTTFKTGIPIIAEGEIDLSVEVSGEYEWGKTTETSSEISTVLQVTVPAMSKVKVSLLATQGTCDVPFSYSQFDTFTDGTQKISGMADGVYTGINSYNFKYETTEEKL